MTVSATARETRVLLTQGPDAVMKARLRAAAKPTHEEDEGPPTPKPTKKR